jgi:viologen exporter family transport system permease protein
MIVGAQTGTAALPPPPRPPGVARELGRVARAFPTLLRVGLSEVVAYRAEFVVWILTTNMPLVMLALWRAVAADGPVGRFGQREFTVYYLGVLLVRLLTSNWVAWQLSTEIRDGTLSAKLLRPVHPLYSLASDHLSAVPMRALVVSPVGVLLLWFGHGRLFGHTPAIALVYALSLAGAWLLSFFAMVALGALAFFIESSLGVFELWLGVYAIFSGYLIPLEALPAWVGRVARVLPFRFMLAFPVETLVGLVDPTRALRELGLQWAYVTVAAVAALALWRAGVRRFAAYGG